MKRHYYIFITLTVLCLMTVSCDNNPTKKINQQNLEETEKRLKQESVLPIIKFDFDTYDYGEVVDGEVVEVDFNFTNTGNSDLIIFNASASCGCTVPEYPQNKNIKPGESSSLKVRFDTSNKPGKQMKTVTLTTNTNSGRKLIRINGFVLNK